VKKERGRVVGGVAGWLEYAIDRWPD